MEKLIKDLINHFSIKTSCIWIDTYEERNALIAIYTALAKYADEKDSDFIYQVMEWSEALGGFAMDPLSGRKIKNTDNAEDSFNFNLSTATDLSEATTIKNNAMTLFQAVDDYQHKNSNNNGSTMKVFIVKEMSELNNDPRLPRYIRDLKENITKRDNYSPIIMISPSANIPNSIQKLFATLKCPLPTVSYIEEFIVPKFMKAKNLDLTEEEISNIAQAAAGLSSVEIKRAFSMSYQLYQKLDTDTIMKEKIGIIQKSGILKYKIPKLTLDDIGGHERLKKWIREVKKCSTKEAIEFGIMPAKGYLSMGVAGSGKTALAEAVANHFGCPLVILDLSKIMGGIVGESERNARMAFEVLDSVGKTVVLLDEAEKALGGIKSSNNSDGGTMARVFGVILEHMNNNKEQFYILTSNNVADLPPELSRSGRLDNKWFFWYPSKNERKDIFNIHFKKHGKIISDELLNFAAEIANNYTGAEIENSVNNIIKHAFLDMIDNNGDGQIIEKYIREGISEVTPVYQTSKAEVSNMRMYAEKNHIPYTSDINNVSQTVASGTNIAKNFGKEKATKEGSIFDDCFGDM